jgi:hypothetical protein
VNDDLSRDPLDDELARRLRALGGPDDTRSVLHAMRPRFVAAQRRRRAALASGAAMTAVLLVGTAAALSGGGLGPRVETVPPAEQPSSSSIDGPVLTDDRGNPVVTDDSASGVGPTVATKGDPDDNDGSGGTTDTSPGSGSTPGSGDTAPTRPTTDTTRPPTGSTTTEPDDSTTTTPDPTTTTQPSASTKVCVDPAGNSITVRWNGSELSLVAAVAAAGWARNFDDDFAFDEIRIEFESGASGYRIRGRWHNGAIECSWSTFSP